MDVRMTGKDRGWRFSKSTYGEWKGRFLSAGPSITDTEAVCRDCTRSMPLAELAFRALLTAEGAMPTAPDGRKGPPSRQARHDGTYIIYTYVCEHTQMPAPLIDDLIRISSGRFDFEAWDWTDEASLRAVREVGREILKGGHGDDRLDWAAIRDCQKNLPEKWKRQRYPFFEAEEKGKRKEENDEL